MYATPPNAAAATPPLSQLQHQAPQVQHGHPQGMPPAVQHGGSHGIPGAGVPNGHAMAPAPSTQRAGAMFVTGAYQASGDPAIDRMIQLEAALKRFGSPI